METLDIHTPRIAMFFNSILLRVCLGVTRVEIRLEGDLEVIDREDDTSIYINALKMKLKVSLYQSGPATCALVQYPSSKA